MFNEEKSYALNQNYLLNFVNPCARSYGFTKIRIELKLAYGFKSDLAPASCQLFDLPLYRPFIPVFAGRFVIVHG